MAFIGSSLFWRTSAGNAIKRDRIGTLGGQ
jgi:hypothetical protein